MKHKLAEANEFNQFSIVVLNSAGQFIDPGKDYKEFSDATIVTEERLPMFLKESVVLPEGVTDVFVWAHGWKTDCFNAVKSGRRIFQGIIDEQRLNAPTYTELRKNFVPAFVLIHWPSESAGDLNGFQLIRDRAAELTTSGYAEFFLASLLGYLDFEKTAAGGPSNKLLRARGGFYVHCVGHSFGGRFLTAAVRAARAPESPKTLALLEKATRMADRTLLGVETSSFEFSVDNLLIFQMAAPESRFATELDSLTDVQSSGLCGPVVLTYSKSDLALQVWHTAAEWEMGIGYSGAKEPINKISRATLLPVEQQYKPSDFCPGRVVNVDASTIFTDKAFPSGSHSDIWYRESMHLLLSLAEFSRGY